MAIFAMSINNLNFHIFFLGLRLTLWQTAFFHKKKISWDVTKHKQNTIYIFKGKQKYSLWGGYLHTVESWQI